MRGRKYTSQNREKYGTLERNQTAAERAAENKSEKNIRGMKMDGKTEKNRRTEQKSGILRSIKQKTEKENKNTGNSKVFQNKENQRNTVEYTHVKDEAVKFHCTQNTDSFHTPRIQIISRGSVQILSFRLNKTECPWHWEGDWIIPDTEDENVKEIELLVISQVES